MNMRVSSTERRPRKNAKKNIRLDCPKVNNNGVAFQGFTGYIIIHVMYSISPISMIQELYPLWL
jgi:hypothetical protein